jgi:tRNA A37 threonylcarbamoyltransferase TsaD
VYVFDILAVEVSKGIVAYGTDKVVGVGGTTAEKSIGQMIDEVTDRYDV